jgi:hypothetical protein
MTPMLDTELAPERQAWHKQLAMLCNNRAWALSGQDRTAAEDREMLTTAHTSAYHWALVGTELNRMRATALLAQVHAFLGHGETSFALATDMRNYFLGRAETPDWELAFTHVIYAHSACVAGRPELHAVAYQAAVAAMALIVDEEDRRIVNEAFKRIPVPS